MTFQSLNLSSELLRTLEEVGFDQPTPIQKQVIPVQLNGSDVVGQAQTGTGKTAAFGIPILERLTPREGNDGKHSCDALILTPTRELTNQVTEELKKLGKYKNLSLLSIYGGVSIEQQIKLLRKKVNIIVATPGRLLDHLNRGTVDLTQVRHFVLDEADEMLDMGFIQGIHQILKNLPSERQMLLFSATMSPEIKTIAKQYMTEPVTISVSKQTMVLPKIDQWFHRIAEWERLEGLCRVLNFYQPEMVLIFCQTKREVDELYRQLRDRDYRVEALHGDYSQYQREQVMQKFRNNDLHVLISTDLAARGIDANLEMVINYSIPENPEIYVHRIGRTGRAGRSGKAVTFATIDNSRQIHTIEKLIRTRIRYRNLPTREELKEQRKNSLAQKIEAGLQQESSADYIDLAAHLLEKASPVELIAATLKVAGDAISPIISVDRQHELSAENTGAEHGMVRFFLNGGKNTPISAGDLVRTVTRNTKIPGNEVGKILIQDDFSFLEVPENQAKHLLQTLPSFMLHDKQIVITPAKARSKVARFKDYHHPRSRSQGSQRRISNA